MPLWWNFKLVYDIFVTVLGGVYPSYYELYSYRHSIPFLVYGVVIISYHIMEHYVMITHIRDITDILNYFNA